MKKIIAIILAALMLFAFTACGGSDDENINIADPEKAFVVGICQYNEHDSLSLATQGFMEALAKELGTENVIFDIQNAFDNSDTCASIINRFITRDVDLILANSTPSLQAAATATVDIPILGTAITDYATALELEDFTGTVGGNISGTSDMVSPEEQARIMLEFVPDAETIGMLYCTSEENSLYQIKELKGYLEAEGATCVEVPFTDTNDIADCVKQAVKTCDAIYIPADNKAAAAAEIIDNICGPAEVPVFAADEGTYSACGVATLSASYYHLGYKTGEMAAKILSGEENISTMPVVYAEELALKYDKERCEELGLTIPQS